MNWPHERKSELFFNSHILNVDQHIRLEGAYQITKNEESVVVLNEVSDKYNSILIFF